MKFSEKCKKLRTEKGLSQKDTAKAAGISRRTYIYYEKGQKYPRTKETVQNLADVFGVEPSYLMSESSIIPEIQKPLTAAERAEAIIKNVNELLNDESVDADIKKSLCLSLTEEVKNGKL